MLALDKCPKVASAENARRGFTKMYEPNASPSVKFTAAVLPGGTLLVVNTVPPTIATYGAFFFQLVKFHCQIAGLTLAPYTPPAGGSTANRGSTSTAHSKLPRRMPGRWFAVRIQPARPPPNANWVPSDLPRPVPPPATTPNSHACFVMDCATQSCAAGAPGADVAVGGASCAATAPANIRLQKNAAIHFISLPAYDKFFPSL